jgi:hypothetical protein
LFLVICGMISMSALVSKAIAMFLQKAWGICNAYKHGTPVVDVFESASERRGADGIDARACMATTVHIHIYIVYIYIYVHVYYISAQLRSARPTASSCTFHVPCMSIFLI